MSARRTARKLRELLQANPDGMTVQEIVALLGTTQQNIGASLKVTWGCYIERWIENRNGPATAVWKCVAVPASAPRPTPKPSRRKAVAKVPRVRKMRVVAPRKAAPEPSKHTPQGLTVIRGPWPTFKE